MILSIVQVNITMLLTLCAFLIYQCKGDIISLAHFDKYVESRHQGRDKLFEAEYAVSI